MEGPLHTRDWEPMAATLQALSFVEKWEPVQVRFTLRLRDQQSKWMQDGCKVYMDSYVTSNGSCFMVTSIIFKNHLLKVGLTHNHRFNLFYYCEDPNEYEFIEVAFGWRSMTTRQTWVWRVCWDGLCTLFFWALTISWSRLLARVWSDLMKPVQKYLEDSLDWTVRFF